MPFEPIDEGGGVRDVRRGLLVPFERPFYTLNHRPRLPTYESERKKYTVHRTPGNGAHLGCPDDTCPCPKK